MDGKKKRRWYVAGLLSMLMTGLGQLYNGRPQKCVFLIAMMAILTLFFVTSDLPDTFAGLVTGLSTLFIVYLFSIIEAVIEAARSKWITPRWYNRWYAYLPLVLIYPLVLGPAFLHFTNYKPYFLRGESMCDTLLVGDFALAAKDFRPRDIVSRDIVIFVSPADHSRHYMKRLIGLPGDKIMIKDKEVWRNGKKLAEPYVKHLDERILAQTCVAPPTEEDEGCPCRDNIEEFMVPPGMYFVLGDNRDASRDSRCFGFVPGESILGKALYLYLSLDPETGELRRDRIGLRLN